MVKHCLLFVLGVSLLVIAAVAVVVPASLSVDAAKTAVFAVFLEVPVPVIRALRNKTYATLQASSSENIFFSNS